MAGTTEIREVVDNGLNIAKVAMTVGPDGWVIDGNTLTINNPGLLDAVRKLVESADPAQLTREATDLRPVEVIGLARHVLDKLPDILRVLDR